MSHFYGTFPPLTASTNLEPVISWLGIIGIGFLAYYMARLLVKHLC